MAYMSQEIKKRIAIMLKDALKNWDIKYTLGVDHYSTIVMNIKSGDVDFFNDRTDKSRPDINVNPYWYKEHFTGRSLELLNIIFPILNAGNHNNSDLMTDYYDVGWYVSVNVGKYNKPYILTVKKDLEAVTK